MQVEEAKRHSKRETGRDAAADLGESSLLAQQQKQLIQAQSEDGPSSESSEGRGWSDEVIEPAIKTMNYRSKRGTRMKELMRGRGKKDQFWERYQGYFGGDLNREEDSDDLEDYEASSSGRDEFDSDFDLTDSYVGKRGRKKGSKIKKRGRRATKVAEPRQPGPRPGRGRRGRKPKVTIDLTCPFSVQRVVNRPAEEAPRRSKHRLNEESPEA